MGNQCNVAKLQSSGRLGRCKSQVARCTLHIAPSVCNNHNKFQLSFAFGKAQHPPNMNYISNLPDSQHPLVPCWPGPLVGPVDPPLFPVAAPVIIKSFECTLGRSVACFVAFAFNVSIIVVCSALLLLALGHRRRRKPAKQNKKPTDHLAAWKTGFRCQRKRERDGATVRHA